MVRGRCFEAVLAHDRLTNLVHGAQVKDEMVSGLDGLVAVLANKLQNTTNAMMISAHSTCTTYMFKTCDMSPANELQHRCDIKQHIVPVLVTSQPQTEAICAA